MKKKKEKTIDWGKALKQSKRLEMLNDAKRVRELVKELFWIFKKYK